VAFSSAAEIRQIQLAESTLILAHSAMGVLPADADGTRSVPAAWNRLQLSALRNVWADTMAGTVFERVEQLLASRGVPFAVLRHAPVFTSADAAVVRGTPLASGAKALVCKADGQFVMFVLPADLKLVSALVRRLRQIKSLRFATEDEVRELTGLAPGSIPPFGSLFGLKTYCDTRLAQHQTINFNAGDHAISVSMPYESFLAIEQPEPGIFGE
jgi:Ala-tRNA(Pro) deacylase